MNLRPWRRPRSETISEPVRLAIGEAAAAAARESAGVVAEAIRAAWMAPATPEALTAPTQKRPIYTFDDPWRWFVPQAPRMRPGAIVTVDMLRRLADTYDILRSCIQHLKREVTRVPLVFVPEQDGDDSRETRRQIGAATDFVRTRGGLGGVGKTRMDFEGQLLEDVMVVGAGASYFQPSQLGTPLAVIPIDAVTIRPRVDAWGWPGPDEEVWEQWVQGILVGRYTLKDLSYFGLSINARSYSPFYASPVEWLVLAITSALRADEWNRGWLTDGTTPSDLIALPESWTPDMVKDFSGYWDAMLAGQTKQRVKSRFVPGGSQRVGTPTRKDQEFQQFELWLLRRTCSVMGVQAASIGFAGEQYKVSQDASIDTTSEFGAGNLLDWRAAWYNDLCERMEWDRIEARNVTAQEEDAASRAERLEKAAGRHLTINEARGEDGRDPIEGGDVIMVSANDRPLEQALAPPQPLPAPAGPGPAPSGEDDNKADTDVGARRAALRLWERKAINRLRMGRSPACPFESDAIPHSAHEELRGRLPLCASAADVRTLFRSLEGAA